MDRRTFLKVAGGTAAALAVGGIAGYSLRTPEVPPVTQVTTATTATTAATVTAPVAKKTLTLIHVFPGAEWPLFEPVVKDAETRLGITIRPIVIRTPDLVPIVTQMFPQQETPGDVMFTWWRWLLYKLAKEGHLIDVTDLYANESQLLPGVAERYTIDGKIWGVPHAQKVRSCLWYRKSFFKAHNIALPKSWDEFTSLLGQLSEISGIKAPIGNGNTSWPISLNNTLDAVLLTYAGYETHSGLINGQVKWTDEQVKKVLSEHFVPILKYFGEPVEWVSGIDLWWRGDYALYPCGSWILGMVKDPSDVGLLLLPEQKAVAYTYDAWFGAKYTPYPNESKALMKYFMSAEGQTLQVRQGGYVPARKDVPLDAFKPADRELWDMVKDMKIAMSPAEGSIGGIFTEKLPKDLELLWSSPGKLDSVLQDLQSAAEEELKK